MGRASIRTTATRGPSKAGARNGAGSSGRPPSALSRLVSGTPRRMVSAQSSLAEAGIFASEADDALSSHSELQGVDVADSRSPLPSLLSMCPSLAHKLTAPLGPSSAPLPHSSRPVFILTPFARRPLPCPFAARISLSHGTECLDAKEPSRNKGRSKTSRSASPSMSLGLPRPSPRYLTQPNPIDTEKATPRGGGERTEELHENGKGRRCRERGQITRRAEPEASEREGRNRGRRKDLRGGVGGQNASVRSDRLIRPALVGGGVGDVGGVVGRGGVRLGSQVLGGLRVLDGIKRELQ